MVHATELIHLVSMHSTRGAGGVVIINRVRNARIPIVAMCCVFQQVSKVMDQFEKQFEDLDLNSEYMENAMQSSTAQTMPEDDVENLMHQVSAPATVV